MNRIRFAALALALLLLAGCGSSSAGSSFSSAAPVPSVQVDWSKLEQDEPVRQANRDEGRWYAGAMTALIPSEEYGPLVPYVGSLAYSFHSWTDQNGQEQTWYSSWGSPLYGLMTREGKMVVDPVYQSVAQPAFYWQGATTYLPVLILTQAREEWMDTNNGQRCAVAALDGSWCTDFEFWLYTNREDELLLVGPKGLTWMDAASGNRLDWNWDFLGIGEDELPALMEQLMWLYGFNWIEEGVLLGLENPDDWQNTKVRMFQPETLEITWISRADYDTTYDQWIAQRNDVVNEIEWSQEIDGDQFVLLSGERRYILTPPAISDNMSHAVMGDLASVQDWSGEQTKCWLFRLSDGSLLYEGTNIDFVYDSAIENPAPYVSVIDSTGKAILYAPDLSPLLIHHLPDSSSWVYYTIRDGLVSVRDDTTFFGCYDVHTGDCIFYRNLTLGD